MGFNARHERHFMVLVEDAERKAVAAAIQKHKIPDNAKLTAGLENLGEGKFSEVLTSDLNARAYAENHIDAVSLVKLRARILDRLA